jgi:hypothetical protein
MSLIRKSKMAGKLFFADEANIGSGFYFDPTGFCIVTPSANYNTTCLVSFYLRL